MGDIKLNVSIIIVNYNTLELTKNTIESVFEKTKDINYEIILVDNASVDGSVEFFEKNYSGKIIFIKSNENLGFGRANNKGIEKAKGKYIFLLNSDTLLINNAIKILFDFMEKNNDVGICGGNLFDKNLLPTHSFRLNLTSLKTEMGNFFNVIEKINVKYFNRRKDFNYTNKEIEVGYILGANIFTSKKNFEKVDGFSKDIFMYYEDVELAYKIKKNGYKIYNVPDAKIIHLEGQSFDFKEERYRRQIQGKYIYFIKCYGKNSIKKLYKIHWMGLMSRYLLTFNKKYLKMLEICKQELKNAERKLNL